MTEQTSPVQRRGWDWNEFFGFRFLITPVLIRWVYVIGAAIITVLAVAALFTTAGGPVIAIFSALAILVFGNLVWRVYMELVMLLFRINDSLQEIERRGHGV